MTLTRRSQTDWYPQLTICQVPANWAVVNTHCHVAVRRHLAPPPTHTLIRSYTFPVANMLPLIEQLIDWSQETMYRYPKVPPVERLPEPRPVTGDNLTIAVRPFALFSSRPGWRRPSQVHSGPDPHMYHTPAAQQASGRCSKSAGRTGSLTIYYIRFTYAPTFTCSSG